MAYNPAFPNRRDRTRPPGCWFPERMLPSANCLPANPFRKGGNGGPARCVPVLDGRECRVTGPRNRLPASMTPPTWADSRRRLAPSREPWAAHSGGGHADWSTTSRKHRSGGIGVAGRR